jgi:hypothetical protein
MANCGAGFGCVLGHLRKQTPVVLALPPPHFIHSDKAVAVGVIMANCGAVCAFAFGHVLRVRAHQSQVCRCHNAF